MAITNKGKNKNFNEKILAIKVDGQGNFNNAISAEPFLLKDAWVEISKFGEKPIPGLELGVCGQLGQYEDINGNYLVYFKYQNLFFKASELAGCELIVQPNPSKLKTVILSILHSWSNPLFPWPF